jgi:membrane-anchored mycosin MYCP
MRRLIAITAVLPFVATIALAMPVASAIVPPQIPPGPPPVGPVAPLGPTEQKAACGVGRVFPGSRLRQSPSADTMLNYTGAWQFSRGAGQKIAVIDTGVSPNPRLRALEGGGDYVSASDGLVDCDAHGTLVAGLIAAAPSADDGFAGVAPDATILSIRQTSDVYAPQGASAAQDDPNSLSPGYGMIQTLALAIVRAVDLGATVINLSEGACVPAGAGLDDSAVGQAVRYAFERNVVVVAAAGNVNSEGLCSMQNEVRDPNLPLADAWRSVRTISSPAWFDDYVLAVGAVTAKGAPADFTLHGPWVDVGAPGEGLTSLSPTGGLMNAWVDQQGGLVAVNGTSFAAPLVSGVVALVRSRFPTMTAAEVMDRVKRTAHTPQAGPNAASGYGVVDPIAALTYDLPPGDEMPVPVAAHAIAMPPGPDRGSGVRNVVLAVVCGCLAVAAVTVLAIRKPGRR